MKCESCNSEIIIIKVGDAYGAECSYCGLPAEVNVGVDLAKSE